MTKNFLISFLILGLVFGQQRAVTIQKKLSHDDQVEQKTEINIVSEGDQLKVTINKNGDEREFTVNRKDRKSLEKVEDALEDLGLDLESLILDDDNVFAIHTRGYLGVQIQNLTDQLRAFFKVKNGKGVLITEVVEDSPAEEAGLKAGDVIIKVNHRMIENADDLQTNIQKYDPDTEVKLTLVRRGREKTITATLGAQDHSFSWIGDMPNKYRRMAFKLHDHNEDLDDELPPDFTLPEEMKYHMIQSGEDDIRKELKELHQELKELREEIEKLKHS
jgi:membrane-associated protease RseP (regulator of RpoE activity)